MATEARFLSIFVGDLDAATARLSTTLGIEPSPASGDAPNPHPFASRGPIEFDLGTIRLAVYQAAPQRGTHPGDIALGLASDDVGATAAEAAAGGNNVFCPPRAIESGARSLSVFVSPDRHFFEVVGDT